MRDEKNAEEINETQEPTADIPTEEGGDKRNEETLRLQKEVEELKDKYIRLVADFENFRRRTAKERLELIQTASKDLINSLLPVLDDLERAEKQMQSTQDIEAIKEGERLVFNKLRSTLQAQGLRQMETIGKDFNPEVHEAIADVPAPKPGLREKVIDEAEKGYYLNDKIIRFPKVIVGK